jgi:hypothetical protein
MILLITGLTSAGSILVLNGSFALPHIPFYYVVIVRAKN